MGSTFAVAHGEEVLVPPPPVVPPITHVRGTLISASIKTLTDRGYGDRYWAALPAEHHAAMRGLIASSWVPEPLAFQHYGACDRLQIPPHELTAIGSEVGQRIRETFLGALFRVAREAGSTPWIYLEHLPKLFTRMTIGGACGVYKLGPKEARCEWYGMRATQTIYFRTAFRGANQSILELFCRKAYVVETKAVRGGSWAFRASWA